MHLDLKFAACGDGFCLSDAIFLPFGVFSVGIFGSAATPLHHRGGVMAIMLQAVISGTRFRCSWRKKSDYVIRNEDKGLIVSNLSFGP